MRKCAPGGGEALNWSQNSGGWSRTSHPPSVPRGENTRSLSRGASSSRRMPAISPSKPYLASASFSPSVLRAADRAAGGKVGFLLEQIRKYPGEITQVAIGPLMNVGAAIDQDAAAFRRLKRVVLMGGSVRRGYGDLGYTAPVPPMPEWNILNDVASAQKLFAAGVPL